MDWFASITSGSYIEQVAVAAWRILQESSAYILVGFLVAGLLKAFIPKDLIQRNFGQGSLGGIFKASLLGIPLPL